MAKKKRYTKTLGLLVAEDVYKRIMDLSDQQEKSIAEWLRDAIEHKLVHEQENQHNEIKAKMEEK